MFPVLQPSAFSLHPCPSVVIRGHPWSKPLRLFAFPFLSPACRVEASVRRLVTCHSPRFHYCPFTRKKLAVFVMGMFVLWPVVVAMSLHETAGRAPVRCTTNGGVPPLQLTLTFVPVTAMATRMTFVTLTTTASYATACTPSAALSSSV